LSLKFVDAVINCKNLNYKNILKDITFDIHRGDYVAIIGPNGGGKTTLAKILLRLLHKENGEIKLFGKKIEQFKNYEKIGYVPQRVSQVDENFPVTVEEVIKMGLAYKSGIFSRVSKDDLERVDAMAEKMGVASLKHRKIGELSGGQKQRVMIARALVQNPEILILDEPNTGVDQSSQKEFYELLKKLNHNENITILFITHDLGVIIDDVNNVLCINQTLLGCHNPKDAMACDFMSDLYGVESHVVCHHH